MFNDANFTEVWNEKTLRAWELNENCGPLFKLRLDEK